MTTLSSDLRSKLERTCIAARNLAEQAAKNALRALAVHQDRSYDHMSEADRNLRKKLVARGKAAGDKQDAKGQLAINHIAQECAYEHWHRMLFARFLAENNLLIEPDMGVAVSLEECKELAKDAKTNLWALAGRFAQTMLPEIFRADDPVLQVPLAREDQIKLEELLDALAKETFTASDSLGWCYQFWQTERKDQVNAAGNKIGAEELPSVTQLFTEDYMVDFLLDNTLGAWWAGKALASNSKLAESAKKEEELRKAFALPRCPWKYLRFIKGKDDKWTPAAGTFDGWPKTAMELKCLDPCMGSGHFVVAMFERLTALRMAEEEMTEGGAVVAVIRDNLFGLEIDPRCTQIGAFNLALAAWRRVGHRPLPAMNLACSGLAPYTREAEWLEIAGGNQKLQRGMEQLYRLFQRAAVLGSLINPSAGEGDLLVAAFHELQPLLEKALAAEKTTGLLREGVEDTTRLETAVTARGLAKAAEILASSFTLVATNVPYLGRGKQDDVLKDCDVFHQRPFIWHIWDGRKRDGFHALVNYLTLASGDKGRRTLESLTHSYLGEWITRQKDGLKREEEGADERLAAAQALKEILEAIIEGEPPHDIFVRWKPLAQQAIGWNPDINDGVRMNIRPFLARDIPGGKKDAGILRVKPNIKWDKDRGKEPKRDILEFPWFWSSSGFTGDRVNDVHLTIEEKRKPR